MSAFIATLHYWALAIGFAGILTRYLGLSDALAGQSLKRTYLGDALWGVAALLWISTGLIRVFSDVEKGSEYYLHNHWFYAKMGVFVLILLCELHPMITLIRWRMRKLFTVPTGSEGTARCMKAISAVEIFLVLTLPIFASLMARGGLVGQ